MRSAAGQAPLCVGCQAASALCDQRESPDQREWEDGAVVKHGVYLPVIIRKQ